jgi:predicted transcriptional regulator
MRSRNKSEVKVMQPINVKDAAHKLSDQLPEDASWDNVICTLQVRRDIEAGIEDIEAGRVIDGDKVMEWLESWAQIMSWSNPLHEVGVYSDCRA